MIYLDHAATTACAPDVVEAMLPFFVDRFANASSIDHVPGNLARKAIDEAREVVAELVDGRAEDVIFTSGSTEANNLVLSVPFRVLTTPVEHPSILEAFHARRREGDALVAVDNQGRIVIDNLRQQTTGDGEVLVSAIATNNETGVEQNIQELVSVTSSKVLLHFDATQTIGTQRLHLRRDKIDGCSISAHKIYGPKGIGALVASSRLRKAMRPLMFGGGHERSLRPGTLNVPGIVGFGAAAKLVLDRRDERCGHVAELRRRFLDLLQTALGDIVVETITSARVSPHILSLRIRGVNGRALLRAVRGSVAFSLGSACATNKSEPSHVLVALGVERRAIAETIRVSFAGDQPVEEIEVAARAIVEAARSLLGYSLSA